MFLPWRKGRNIGGYSYLCPFNFDVDFMMYSRKEIWQVTYPILLGLLAQNVINVTDTAFLRLFWGMSVKWHWVPLPWEVCCISVSIR